MHISKFRVYYEDTDAGGVIYYANYLKFLERARSEFLRDIGFTQTELLAQHAIVFVVTTINLNYIQPARLDDMITVKTVINKLEKTSILFSQNIYRGKDLLTDSEIKVVCVQLKKFKPCRIPESLISKIR